MIEQSKAKRLAELDYDRTIKSKKISRIFKS